MQYASLLAETFEPSRPITGPNDSPFELGSSGFTAAKKDQVAFVVASVRKDDRSWIAAFPEWSHHICFIDDFYAYLRVPVNKGREAMVYLT